MDIDKLLWIYVFFAAAFAIAVAFHEGEQIGFYPENVTIAEGQITGFEPYFDHIRSDQHGPHHGHSSPLNKEGIQVSICYPNQDGESATLREDWPMPCVDFFQENARVAVIWSSGNDKPASFVAGERRLRRSLKADDERETPSNDLALWEQRKNEIEDILQTHDKMLRLVDLYEKDFGDTTRPVWKWEDVRSKWAANNDLGNYHRRFDRAQLPQQEPTELDSGQPARNVAGEADPVTESLPFP